MLGEIVFLCSDFIIKNIKKIKYNSNQLETCISSNYLTLIKKKNL